MAQPKKKTTKKRVQSKNTPKRTATNNQTTKYVVGVDKSGAIKSITPMQ